MPVCEVDLRPGGSWHFVWCHSSGKKMEMRGEYREVKPPERLVSSESWGPDWPETINTLELSEHASKTTATITILYVSKEARDAALSTGMQRGVASSYNRLETYLESLKA